MRGAPVDKALSTIAQVSRVLRSIMHITDMGASLYSFEGGRIPYS